MRKICEMMRNSEVQYFDPNIIKYEVNANSANLLQTLSALFRQVLSYPCQKHLQCLYSTNKKIQKYNDHT